MSVIHLSDNYINLSDLYVNLLDNYINFPDLSVDLLDNNLENRTSKYNVNVYPPHVVLYCNMSR